MGRRRRYAPSLLPFALLVGLIAGPASPAFAAFPGSNGVIAFEHGGDIWVMNADGSGQRRVTSCATTPVAPKCADSDSGFIGPTFAPDGRLAFWSFSCNDSGYCVESIYVSQGGGTGLRFLTRGFDPAW